MHLHWRYVFRAPTCWTKHPKEVAECRFSCPILARTGGARVSWLDLSTCFGHIDLVQLGTIGLRDQLRGCRQTDVTGFAICPRLRGAGYEASAKRLRQHGHSPSNPLASDENADGWGMVMMALYASGARSA